MKKRVRIAATSDLHGYLPENIPSCDILTIAGDIVPLSNEHHDPDSPEASRWVLQDLHGWLEGLGVPVVAIGGNHDFVFEKHPQLARSLPWHYLFDSGCEIDGVSFWGSPYTPTFFDWAFMKKDWDLEEHWNEIPTDTDVLLTHGPPRKRGDRTATGEDAGSKSLLAWTVKRPPGPLLHCFGHIHEGAGQTEIMSTGYQWANVSRVDRKYRPINPICVFDVLVG